MATTSISQMTTAATVDNGDLFEIAHPDNGSATGYASNKQSMAAIADHMATAVNYPTMNTTAKTIVGAINELEAGGGGGGSSTLAGLTDVDISSPTNGQTLIYNATSGKWENGAGGGGGGSINYSETETLIGTWYGVPLYQKTISYTSPGGTLDTDTIIDSTLQHGTNCFIVAFEGVYGYGYMNAASHSEAPRTMNGTTSPEPLGQATLHLPWYGGGTTNAPMIYCYSDGIHFMKNGGTSEAKSVSLTVRYVKKPQ